MDKMGLLIEVLARHNALGLVACSGQSYMQHAYSQHGLICLHRSVIPITIHAFVLKAPLDISILLLLPLGYLLGSPLVLLRGGGVTAAPAAKLSVAPDTVHRFKPVTRAARRSSEHGKKLGPPSVARPSSGCH